MEVKFLIPGTVLFRLNYAYLSVTVSTRSLHNSFTGCHLCVICVSPVRNADLVLPSCTWSWCLARSMVTLYLHMKRNRVITESVTFSSCLQMVTNKINLFK